MKVLSEDILKTFATIPECYLILSPDLVILTATNAYLKSTSTQLENLKGKYIRDAFSEEGTAGEKIMDNLEASLRQVLVSKEPHQMAPQRFDLTQPAGTTVAKYWRITNTPILDEHGEIFYIIHKSEAVTENIHQEKLSDNPEDNFFEEHNKLKESESRWKAAINVSPVVLSILRSLRNEQHEIIDFQMDWVSKSGEELVSQEVTGRQLLVEFPYILEIEAFQKLVSTVESDEPTEFEYSYPVNEEIRWVRWRALGFNDGLFVSVEDITGLKRSEEALKEEHRRLKESQAIGHIGSFEWDAASDTIYWSDEMYRIHGLEPQGEIITFERVLNFLNPEDEPWVKESFLASREKNYSFEFIHRIIRADGELRYLLRSFESRADASGKIISLTGTAQDITKQKKAEEDILKHLTFLKQAEETGRMGSWEYDLTTGTFQWSEGMYRLFGLPLGKKVSLQTFLAFVIREDRPIAEKIINYLQGPHNTSFDETTRICVQDQVLTLKIKAVLFRNDLGKPIKMLGVIQDVSEVKRLEKENLQIRLNQQKALLIAILEAQEEERRRISESLHNGVSQILYATQLNLNQVKQQLPVELQEQNKPLENTLQFLREATQETRRVSHELVPMILKDFGLDYAIRDLCNRFSFDALQFECEVDGFEEKLEPYLETVLYRISQELVNNIVKHADATRANLLLINEESEICLKVRDNGRGIRPDANRKKGIGLPSVIDRVKLLNGSIRITTPETGTGTLIIINIPLGKIVF